jgi:hypothetical protein
MSFNGAHSVIPGYVELPSVHIEPPANFDESRQHNEHYVYELSELPEVVPATMYFQPDHADNSFIAELPAPSPPAPRTSTPAEQLNHDELFAHKLQRMEITEARKRSTSSLIHRSSQYSLQGPVQSPPYPSGHLNHPPPGRLHSTSLSSQWGQDSYIQASRVQLSHQPSHEDFAPEVVPPRSSSIWTTSSMRSHESLPPYTTAAQLSPALTNPLSLSAYLEENRQVPYPPQWVLPPVTKTFYGSIKRGADSDWLDVQERQHWHTVRTSDPDRFLTDSPFSISFKSKGGSFRDPRCSWTMTDQINSRKNTKKSTQWTYSLTLDRKTGKRIDESLRSPEGKYLHCTYVHALNYDALNFRDLSGRAYKWVSSGPVSSLNGSRYDALRHALFMAPHNNVEPVYGQIVADHAYWDGFIDENEVHVDVRCGSCTISPIIGRRWKCRTCPEHDVCDYCKPTNLTTHPTCNFTLVSMPDETLHIRSDSTEVDMVIATLQVMKDWEKVFMKEEKKQEVVEFAKNVENIRKGDLGRIAYWRHDDFEGTGVGDEVHGTLIKAKENAKVAKGPRMFGASASSLALLASGPLATVGTGINMDGSGAATIASTSAGATGVGGSSGGGGSGF